MKTENSQTHYSSTQNQAEPRQLSAIHVCLQNHEDLDQGTAESN